jgi:hypothetical protein
VADCLPWLSSWVVQGYPSSLMPSRSRLLHGGAELHGDARDELVDG